MCPSPWWSSQMVRAPRRSKTWFHLSLLHICVCVGVKYRSVWRYGRFCAMAVRRGQYGQSVKRCWQWQNPPHSPREIQSLHANSGTALPPQSYIYTGTSRPKKTPPAPKWSKANSIHTAARYARTWTPPRTIVQKAAFSLTHFHSSFIHLWTSCHFDLGGKSHEWGMFVGQAGSLQLLDNLYLGKRNEKSFIHFITKSLQLQEFVVLLSVTRWRFFKILSFAFWTRL